MSNYKELFTTKGKKPLSNFQITKGRLIKREYDKNCKSFVIKIDGNVNVTRLKLPKKNFSLNIHHKYLILQLFPLGGNSYVELIILDNSKNRRRFIFSSNFTSIHLTPFHIQIPFNPQPFGCWLNCCFNVHSIFSNCFKWPNSFGSVEQIILGPKFKLRKIFSMKNNPKNEVSIPKSVNFLSGVVYELFMQNVFEDDGKNLISIKKIEKKTSKKKKISASQKFVPPSPSNYNRRVKTGISVSKPHIAFGRRFLNPESSSPEQRPTTGSFISQKKKTHGNYNQRSKSRRTTNFLKKSRRKNMKYLKQSVPAKYSPSFYQSPPRKKEKKEYPKKVKENEKIGSVVPHFVIPPFSAFRKKKGVYDEDMMSLSRERKYNPKQYSPQNVIEKEEIVLKDNPSVEIVNFPVRTNEKSSADQLFEAIEMLENENDEPDDSKTKKKVGIMEFEVENGENEEFKVETSMNINVDDNDDDGVVVFDEINKPKAPVIPFEKGFEENITRSTSRPTLPVVTVTVTPPMSDDEDEIEDNEEIDDDEYNEDDDDDDELFDEEKIPNPFLPDDNDEDEEDEDEKEESKIEDDLDDSGLVEEKKNFNFTGEPMFLKNNNENEESEFVRIEDDNEMKGKLENNKSIDGIDIFDDSNNKNNEIEEDLVKSSIDKNDLKEIEEKDGEVELIYDPVIKCCKF